jgi:uncharacterized protein (TIGR02996 family)
MQFSLRVAAAVAGAVLAVGAAAEPFLPNDDATVLERLPSRAIPQLREAKAMPAAEAPHDVGAAVARATAYVRASRVEGDPRYLGYAEAALRPWWADAAAPTVVLVLRATIRQSRHEFDAALADLDRVLQRSPRHAQALLTRATVLTVQGRYGPARDDCARLAGLVPARYAAVCAAAIDSVTGRADAAYAAVAEALADAPRGSAAERAWAQTLLGEIAHRRGDAAAEAHFRAALAADPGDVYLRAAYSDWLLDERRPADVVALLAGASRVDPLLLRLALAQKALGDPEAAASIAALAARFDAIRARGDRVHEREQARFELFLDANPAAALALARSNWAVQREPADLRVLAEAAAAANDRATLALVRQWLAQTGFDYPTVAALATPRRLAR